MVPIVIRRKSVQATFCASPNLSKNVLNSAKVGCCRNLEAGKNMRGYSITLFSIFVHSNRNSMANRFAAADLRNGRLSQTSSEFERKMSNIEFTNKGQFDQLNASILLF
jgi:hypothetical protein